MSYGVRAELTHLSAVRRMIEGTSAGRLSACSSPDGTETEASRSWAGVAVHVRGAHRVGPDGAAAEAREGEPAVLPAELPR